MKRLPLAVWLTSLVFAIVATLPWQGADLAERSEGAFVVELQSQHVGNAQLFYDIGRGISEADSVRLPMPVAPASQTLRFLLPGGTLRELRLDPGDRDGEIRLKNPRIEDRGGHVLQTLPTSAVVANVQIAALTPGTDGSLAISLAPGANDPSVVIRPTSPVVIAASAATVWLPRLTRVGVVWALTLLVIAPVLGRRDWLTTRWETLRRRPVLALALVAAVSALASSYPVVFLGKSFVSPNYGVWLLYEETPTIPAKRGLATEFPQGSDIGAAFWQNMPYATIQSRALFEGQVPLWNRYNSVGTSLLGQGQSMFGDPLHTIVLLGGGSAGAWDIKFVVAKWLFAFGLGIAAWQVSRHLPSSLLVGGGAAFMGFFLFRINHPAIFSFCYSPWILVGWLGLIESRDLRQHLLWAGALLAANWTELTSGTAKEAYMLLIGLNGAGALVALCQPVPWTRRIQKWIFAGFSGLALILLSAPIWLTFLDTLKASYTSYNAPSAWQIHPAFLLGLFDEIFYRPIQEADRVSNPSANIVILAGVLYLAATWRRLPPGATATGLAVATAGALALAFGIVPPHWIVRVPFLNNVAHIDNCFSLVAIVLLAPLAACGLKHAATRLGGPEGRGDLTLCALLLLALLLPWFAALHTVHKPIFSDASRFTLHQLGHQLSLSSFVAGDVLALLAALAVAGSAGWCWFRPGANRPALSFVLLAALAVMLWRHGQHTPTRWDAYVNNPPPRMQLDARSAAIDAVRADQPTPARVVGIEGNLFPGWTSTYGLEGINGPDALMSPAYRRLTEVLGFDRVWDWRIMVHSDTLATMRPRYDFLGVRHYLDLRSDQGRLGAQLTPVKMADLDVYRSDTAWPRAFYTNRLRTYDNPAELVPWLAQGDHRPFASVERADLAALPAGAQAAVGDGTRVVAPARDYALTTNRTEFTIDASGPGMVALHETWMAYDFRVTVDGVRQPYFRVNQAFKGVWIDRAGTHRVAFDYRPRRFTLALTIAGVGALLVAAGALLAWWLPKNEPV